MSKVRRALQDNVVPEALTKKLIKDKESSSSDEEEEISKKKKGKIKA